MKLRLLLLAENAALRSRLRRLIADRNLAVRMPRGSEAVWSAVGSSLSDVLVLAWDVIPAPVARSVQNLAAPPNPPSIIVVWDKDDAVQLAEFRAAGAGAALYAGADDDILAQVFKSITEARRQLLTQTVAARRTMPHPRLADFISTSAAMQRFMKTVYRVVDSDAPLLITGETGVGKERLARAIHSESRRADGPFISVNCGAIPENLLESQLFGHEKGAFTGAARAQRGCFELAHDGILLLDEITEMPIHLQVKLLQVLQDYEVLPVGAERRIRVDVRVMAAANRDVTEEVRHGRFRKDLFYRLSVVAIQVPPLRNRKGDIPALASAVVEGLSERIGSPITGITPSAMKALCEYGWPGNVRELINVLERAILLAEGEVIDRLDLPDDIVMPSDEARLVLTDQMAQLPAEWLEMPLKQLQSIINGQVEKAYLSRILTETRGKVGKTAERAGIEPRSLFNKMKRHGLRKEDFRRSRN